MPAQILPDRSHPCVTRHFLSTLGRPSCLKMPQGKAVTENLGRNCDFTDPCLFAEPSQYHGHRVLSQRLLSLGTKQGISTSLSPGQSSSGCRVHLSQMQMHTQVAQAGGPKDQMAFFASFPLTCSRLVLRSRSATRRARTSVTVIPVSKSTQSSARSRSSKRFVPCVCACWGKPARMICSNRADETT